MSVCSSANYNARLMEVEFREHAISRFTANRRIEFHAHIQRVHAQTASSRSIFMRQANFISPSINLRIVENCRRNFSQYLIESFFSYIYKEN